MMRIIRRMEPRDRYLLYALLLTLLALVIVPGGRFPPGLSNAVGILAGAIIGYLISSYFSRKASSELQAEAHKLSLIMRALERADVVEFTRDEHGKEVGVVVKVQASVTASSSVSASAQVERGKDGA
jgi:prepilin signal peptidase PulO-like enzyme (type II secretory pathway)